MTEPDETIHRLMALKRYEQPPPGFVDDFLVKFQERQRVELMKQSLGSLIMERIEGFFERWTTPQLALATVTAVVMLGGMVWLMPSGSAHNEVASSTSSANQAAPVTLSTELTQADILNKTANFGNNLPPEQAAKLSPLLLSKHFVGGYADEAREPLGGDFIQGHSTLAPFEVIPSVTFSDGETAPVQPTPAQPVPPATPKN